MEICLRLEFHLSTSHSQATLNSLAMGRLVTLDQTGSIPTIRTAALPYSDYESLPSELLMRFFLRLELLQCHFLVEIIETLKIASILRSGYLRAAGQAGTISLHPASARILRVEKMRLLAE